MTVKDLSPDCPVYAGIAFRWSGGKNTVEEVIRQIEVSRQQGAAAQYGPDCLPRKARGTAVMDVGLDLTESPPEWCGSGCSARAAAAA